MNKTSGKGQETARKTGADTMTRRSDGVLSRADRIACRESGIALAFDPMQSGWVRADCIDDLGPRAAEPALPNQATLPETYEFRAWRYEDAEQLSRILSSEEIWRYLPEKRAGVIDTEAARALIDLANALNSHEVRAVLNRGRLMGQVRLMFSGEAEAEISYWLDQAVWGQGHGRRIVEKFTRHAFAAHPTLRRIFARVHRDNEASARILRRAGYAENPALHAPPWDTYEVFPRHRGTA